MIQNILTLQRWWKTLSEQWKQVFIKNLELEDCFSERDIEYIFTLTELDCSSSNIQDLRPLYYLTQLEKLDIGNTTIRDFSPIRSLPHLKELNATFSSALDLKVLAGLEELEVLDISYPMCGFINEFELMHLESLRELYSNSCSIQSAMHLVSLPNLEVASLYFNQIPRSEIDSLRSLRPDLKILY